MIFISNWDHLYPYNMSYLPLLKLMHCCWTKVYISLNIKTLLTPNVRPVPLFHRGLCAVVLWERPLSSRILQIPAHFHLENVTSLLVQSYYRECVCRGFLNFTCWTAVLVKQSISSCQWKQTSSSGLWLASQRWRDVSFYNDLTAIAFPEE